MKQIKKLQGISLLKRANDWLLARVVNYYQTWVLPDRADSSFAKRSLLDIKKAEHEHRILLLSPHTRNRGQQLMKDHHSIEKVERISEKEYKKPQFTEYQTKRLMDFKLSYNRHHNAYPIVPLQQYDEESLPHYFQKDKEWIPKTKNLKTRVRKHVYAVALFMVYLYFRYYRVLAHDIKVRNEQRAMQNKQLEQIKEDTPVRVDGLKDLDFNDVDITSMRGSFVIVWADHNFALFRSLMDFLEKKRFAFPLITLVFAVPLDKQNITYSQKLDGFRDRLRYEKSAMSKKWKRKFEVMLIEEQKNKASSLMVDGDRLNLKRGFFFIIAPDGGVIDSAHIFSFQHEGNLFKRISAKINSSISRKGFKVQE